MGGHQPSDTSFRLSGPEQTLIGVKHEGEELRIGPSGGHSARTITLGTLGLVVGVFMVAGLFDGVDGEPVENRTAQIAFGALIAVATSIETWRLRRMGFVATPAELRVRYGVFRRRTFAWTEIAGLEILSTRRNVAPFVNPYALQFGTFGPPDAWERPVVVTAGGQAIGVESLMTFAASEGFSAPASGAQRRLDILLRYRASLGIPWPDPPSRPPPIPRDYGWWWAPIGIATCGATVMLFVRWMGGSWP